MLTSLACTRRVAACVGAWVLLTSVSALKAQSQRDVKGSRDHPMISRIPGSTIRSFEQKEFDRYRLVTGPVSGYAPDGRAREPEEALDEKNSVHLEGRTWVLSYRVPENRSTLEIARSYETALVKAGFRTLFRCSGLDCAGPEPRKPAPGRRFTPGVHAGPLSKLMMRRAGFTISGDLYSQQHYLAAKLERPEGDVYAAVLALNFDRPITRVDVIEVKRMQTNLVTVDAALMATEIAAQGSVALYGIYFDTDKTDLKPESRPTLTEIATLLKQDATLELIVVGHTDNQGTLDYNVDLSRRRAQAVVAALVSDFGVPRERLEARGVGYLAPVAPNSAESGRARNRRVQLVPR